MKLTNSSIRIAVEDRHKDALAKFQFRQMKEEVCALETKLKQDYPGILVWNEMPDSFPGRKDGKCIGAFQMDIPQTKEGVYVADARIIWKQIKSVLEKHSIPYIREIFQRHHIFVTFYYGDRNRI